MARVTGCPKCSVFEGDPPFGSYTVRLCATHQAVYGYYDTPEWREFFSWQDGPTTPSA